MHSLATHTPFSLGPGPESLASWIDRVGLTKLANLCHLEVHRIRVLAYLGGQPDPKEAKSFDHYLGIPMKSWQP